MTAYAYRYMIDGIWTRWMFTFRKPEEPFVQFVELRSSQSHGAV